MASAGQLLDNPSRCDLQHEYDNFDKHRMPIAEAIFPAGTAPWLRPGANFVSSHPPKPEVTMKEATLRDFFLGTVPVDKLAVEVRRAVEHQTATTRRVHVQDLAAGEELVITAQMLVRLCDAVLAGDLPGPALEPIAFAVIASEHLHWAEDDELVSRVLYDWASPEITWELTPDNVRMFRGWLTGEEQPPPEPEITPDTLSGEDFSVGQPKPGFDPQRTPSQEMRPNQRM